MKCLLDLIVSKVKPVIGFIVLANVFEATLWKEGKLVIWLQSVQEELKS